MGKSSKIQTKGQSGNGNVISSPLEQLLPSTDGSSSSFFPRVRIIRNEAAETAARSLQLKRRVKSSVLNGSGSKPGPKCRKRKVCCLCNATLDNDPSDSWVVTQSNIRLLNRTVFSKEFFGHDKQFEEKELRWICTGCSKAINRIEGFQREIQEIEGKVKEIVQCIRAVYRLKNKIRTPESRAIKNPLSPEGRQSSNRFSFIGEEVFEMEDVKQEFCETGGTDFFPEEIEPDTATAHSNLGDHDEAESDNGFEMSVGSNQEMDMEPSNYTTTSEAPKSTRPSRLSKAKAKELLHSIASQDNADKDEHKISTRTANETSDAFDDDGTYAISDSGDDNFSDDGETGQTSLRKAAVSLCKPGVPQVCNECGETCTSMAMLCSHIKKVHKRDTSKCHLCKKNYGSKSSFLRHYQSVHEGLRHFKCTEPGCSHQFFRREEYKRHMERHSSGVVKSKCQQQVGGDGITQRLSFGKQKGRQLASSTSNDESNISDDDEINTANDCGDENFPGVEIGQASIRTSIRERICEDCGETFAAVSLLWSHIKEAHQRDPSECKLCHKKYSSPRTYLRHYRSVHEKLCRFKCNQCGAEYYDRADYKKHMERHRTGKPMRKEKFRREPQPVEPEEVISGDGGSYTCKCGKIYKEQKSFIRHRQEAHGPRNHMCHICGKGFGLQSSLKNHILFHKQMDEKSIKCDTCGALFISLRTLNEHIDCVHKGIRRYKCNVCKKGFPRKSSLSYHMKHSHKTAEEKLKCPKCSETFKTVYDRKIHERLVHEGGPTFQCRHCPKSFLKQWQLVQHSREHGEKRKFVCKNCNKSFATFTNRLSHIEKTNCGREHLPEFTCSKCPESFLTARKLGLHYGLAHADDLGQETMDEVASTIAGSQPQPTPEELQLQIQIISEPEIEIST